MILQKIFHLVAFAGAFYVSQKLGVWHDPVIDTEGQRSPPPVETEKTEGRPPPVLLKTDDDQKAFFDEEERRKLKRAKEDMERKMCTKSGLCDPPPKPITESVGDALYDTWLAIKKIPSFWKRTADNIGQTICRFFGSDD